MPIFQTSTGGQFYFRFPEGETVDVNSNVSLQDNFSMIRGRHTFKTGYEILRTSINSHLEERPSGTYRLGGTEFPFTPNTGNPFASFLLGTVTRADFTKASATWLPRWWSHALYFQDDWKVTSKLTLNLGLRWQTESPYQTKYGQQSQFDPTAIDPLTGTARGIAPPQGAACRPRRQQLPASCGHGLQLPARNGCSAAASPSTHSTCGRTVCGRTSTNTSALLSSNSLLGIRT